MSTSQATNTARTDRDQHDMAHDQLLDASGLVCPLPVLKAKATLARMEVDQVLKVIVTHQDSTKEFPMLCKLPEFELLAQAESGEDYLFWIKRVAARNN